MSLPLEQHDQVRHRAGFACEYCGVTETDTAGELTIDHVQPQSKGGGEQIDNLVYCCHRCNGYKADYWPQAEDAVRLWNPRQEAGDAHFVELANGRLFAITEVGTFTLKRLRLNRTALIAYRIQRRQRIEEQYLLIRLHDLLTLLGELQTQQETLLEHHQLLLQEQERLIRLLLRFQEPEHE